MPQEFGSSSSSSYIYSICANYSPAQAQQELTLIGNPYMFTAREYDIETGLYYYRARYYNPYIGRFPQTDPAYQGVNLYAYCMNNPLNYTDPTGLSAVYGCNFTTYLITFTPSSILSLMDIISHSRLINLVKGWFERVGFWDYENGRLQAFGILVDYIMPNLKITR